MTYAFRVVAPRERVGISISSRDADGPVMADVLSADRIVLCDAALARILVLYPLLTFKVIAAIHWEALRMWLKGLRLRARPPPPVRTVTVASEAAPAQNA